MNSEEDDRPHDPTAKRLQDAREKGDIPRAADLLTAAAYGGFLLAALLAGDALIAAGTGGAALFSQASTLAEASLQAGQPFALGLARSLVLPLWPFFVLPGIAVIAVLVAQRGIVFSAEKLVPKLSRIDPIVNAKQKFGPEGLMDFVKSLAKLICTTGMLLWLSQNEGDRILAAMTLNPGAVIVEMGRIVLIFLTLIFGIQLVLGMLDTLWQRYRFRQRNRMSDKDVRDEAKESEGDPHIRAQRRQKGQEIALNRMLADLPGADVVIVNPTHYAVALKWDRSARLPPVCVAKGTDDVALRIREAASRHGIPIRHDPPTARALHASVRIGEPIRPEQFRAVAAAIRFAESMRRKAKA